MFYIEKRNRGKRLDFILIHILPTLIVFFAFVGITLVSRESAIVANQEQKNELLAQKTAVSKDAVNSRLLSQQDSLIAAAGLLKASENVTREEWREFLLGFDISNRFPSMQSVGYAKVLTPVEVEPFEASLRGEGFANAAIRPASTRDIYTGIQLIEPLDVDNISALGADMFADPPKRAAMELARDSGKPALTDKLVLVRDAKNPQPSFLIYVPVYKQGAPTKSLEQRRANIDGYVFGAFRTRTLFGNLFKNLDQNFGVKVYDGGLPSEESLLYESTNFSTIAQRPQSQIHIEQFQLNNITWTFAVNEDNGALSIREQRRPTAILWLGLTFSVVIAGLIYMLLTSRTRALAYKDEESVQEAKDELLALASHQLRTPATGVKQYIGMLLEGYGGKVTGDQQKLLSKAYESNERQLNTINEMLFIARADAGEIKLEKNDINLNKLLIDILAEHTQTIHDRRHKLTNDLLSTPVHIHADKKYIRMAVENIVNNAIKYTPNGGKITVAITDHHAYAEIIISDTGVGVERKDFPLLFRKFSRIPNELTRQVSGSGIGLYLAKQIVDVHGGTIQFNSTVGKGTQFMIRLPKHHKEMDDG